MATTTNFGWETPDDTDLVKDGAAAIRTLGQSIDTSMMDLEGGTTGQLLAKNSNTDMDFIWTTPNPGDITGVTAGVGISGGGTSGDVTVTNSMATAITTAGDLIKGTGSGTFNRLGIGTTGQVLTVASGAPSWASPAAAAFKGCSLQLTSSVGVANGTQTVVDFTTELFDTDAFHDTGTNPSRITIPTGLGGKYLLIGASGWANATSATDRGIRITKNGSVSGLPQVNWQTSASGVAYMNIATVVTGVATDYYQVEVIQYNGTSLTLQSATTFFQAIYLGA